MSHVREILEAIVTREGGYVNHPNDRGGPTKYGITQRTLSRYLGRQATIDEVMNLDVPTAIDIYEKYYYYEPRINTLPEPIQEIMTDSAVLYGHKRALIFLQSIVNEAGFGPVDVDGVLGPQTRSKVEECHKAMGDFLINAIVEERIMFCERIVANNPSQKVFLKGWTNRANKFRVQI